MSKRDDRREELEKIRQDAQNDAAREEHDPPPVPGVFAQIFSSEKDVNESYEDIETYENAHESEVKRREEITVEFVEALAEAIREKREAASYSEFIPSPSPSPSNTNIGATTERDTYWGNAIGYSILTGVIIGVLLLPIIMLIEKMGNFSDPLQRPEPEPTSFSVTVDSSPSGATVFIDKKQVGITPFSITLEKGSYGVRVEKEGYENDYKITEGEDLEFNLKSKEE